MSGLADDWDAVPVKAAAQASSGASDWDAVPVKGDSKPQTNGNSITARSILNDPVATKKSLDDSVDGLVGAAGKMVYDTGSAIVGGWRGLATLATGGSLADAAKAMEEDSAYRSNAVPELNKEGKATENVLQFPGMLIGKTANYLGGKTLEATGSPAAATAVDTGINAIPLWFMKKGGKAAPTVAEGGTGKVPNAPAAVVDYDIPTYLRNPKTAPEPIPQPVQQVAQTAVPVSTEVALNEPPIVMPKKESNMMDVFNKKETVPSKEFTPLTEPEQANRAAVLQRIGLEKARASSLSGNHMQGATESQMARFNEPAGIAAREQFDAERAALRNHAESIVSDTGGSMGTDNSALYARGNTMLSPLDGLKEWFDTNTKALYDEAGKRAQGQPVGLDTVNETLGKKSNFTGNTDTLQLRAGVTDRMQELGMLDKDGNVISSTVEQAENLRKYLNEQWTPKNSKTIGMLKDAIDNDVTKAAGEDIYKQARAMRAMRATTLDDPNGIAKIIDASGPNGINRAIATEKIPDAITAMPVDQLNHIVRTLKNVPEELQAQAKTALSEIKAQFANKIIDAGTSRSGQWSARDVAKYLKNNAERMKQVFTSDELAKINDLHEAGKILLVDQSYPGAAAQASNALKSGLMTKSLGRAGALMGAGAGSLVGMPGVGAYFGDVIGNKAATSLGEGAALKKFNKGLTPLRDVSP